MRRRISMALRIAGPTLVYAAERIADVLAALEESWGERIDPIDGNNAAREMIDARAAEGRPIVLVFGRAMSAGARDAISALRDDGAPVPVVAISTARAMSTETSALFPVRMAAVRALEEVA